LKIGSNEKILAGDQGRDVESVTLFLNATTLVSNNGDYNIAQANADLSDLSNLDFSTAIPDNYNDPYIFARVGVKIVGVEDLIFSPVEKIAL